MSDAHVNGLSLYYEEHGSGMPLVLLHGGLGSVEMLGAILPALAEGRRVIGVDLQAHGRTADIDRPLRLELMADDIAALVTHLGEERVDVMGYSLGGGVATRTAIQHAELVRRLVLVSVPFRRTGWYPEVLEGMAQMDAQIAEPMKQSHLYELYSRIAPRVEDWPVLLTKLGDLLRQEYDWSAEVAAMTAPTMLVVGDADAMPPTHAAEFFGLLGGGQHDAGLDGSARPASRLAVLPGTTHYDIIDKRELADPVIAFLDAHLPTDASGSRRPTQR